MRMWNFTPFQFVQLNCWGSARFGVWLGVVRDTALGLRFPFVCYTPWSPWHGRSGFFHALCSTAELLT